MTLEQMHDAIKNGSDLVKRFESDSGEDHILLRFWGSGFIELKADFVDLAFGSLCRKIDMAIIMPEDYPLTNDEKLLFVLLQYMIDPDSDN